MKSLRYTAFPSAFDAQTFLRDDDKKETAIRQAVEAHPSVVRVVEIRIS